MKKATGTSIEELKVVATELKTKVEFSKSTTQTRLMKLVAGSSPMITAEATDPTVNTEAAPLTEVTKEEVVDEPMEAFTKPVVEDTPATDTPPPPIATETSPMLEPGGHKPALKDIVTTSAVITEQNRKITKNNQAAQVQETYSKVGASLTDDNNAFSERAFPFNPDPIRPMSDDTKVSNMPKTAAEAVNKPKVVEPCANAALASMPSYEASTMARPETDPPEVAREGTKSECDPESDNPHSSSRQRFVGPTDKLTMTATAWYKVHIVTGMTSNKKA
jgi:hypothetical protein